MKKIFLFFSLLLIMIISSCKKESPKESPSLKEELGGFIFQYGANIPIEGATVFLLRTNNCGNFINGCEDTLYQTVTTDSTGAFYINPGVTDEINYLKNGYWQGINTHLFSSKSFGASAKFYLNKNAWVKIHVSNTGSTKIDSIQITYPFDYTAAILIAQIIDTAVTGLAAGDAENIFHWTFLTQGFNPVGNEKVDSFYVKSGDTASVNIKAE